jgi:HK97 family phage portal protein
LGLFDRLLGREERAISFQSIWGAGDDINAIGTYSATIVNSDTAFQVNAIYGAVSLISDTISTLPVSAYVRRDGARIPFRPTPAWVNKPDVDTTKEAFFGAAIVSLLLDGNAFIRIYSNPRGEIVNMSVLNPHHVEIKRNGLGRVMFEVHGEPELLSSDEVVFIPDVVRPGHIRGVSRVEALKENFGLAIALQNYAAKFFGSGTQTSGVIEYPGNLTAEQAKALQEGFDARHRGWGKSHRTAIISGGAKYVPTSVENDKAQFLDSRRLAVEDVARAFNIPSNLLNLPGTNTYASVEMNMISFVTHCLRPIVQKLESAFSPLMARTQGGENAFIKFNLDGLLRADINSRMTAYSTGLNSGFLTVNDVRRLEDLRPIEDASADTSRVPLANVNLEAADLVATDKRVTMVSKLVLAGFDPAEALQALGLPPMAHTGVPSVQLQGLHNLAPEGDDPTSVYEVE